MTIVKNAMNIEVNVSFCISVSPRNAFKDHVLILFLVILRNILLFFIVAALMYILNSSVLGLPFLYILFKVCYCYTLDGSHTESCEVISHCAFDLHFSNN